MHSINNYNHFFHFLPGSRIKARMISQPAYNLHVVHCTGRLHHFLYHLHHLYHLYWLSIKQKRIQKQWKQKLNPQINMKKK
jgi:hypothetical protein